MLPFSIILGFASFETESGSGGREIPRPSLRRTCWTTRPSTSRFATRSQAGEGAWQTRGQGSRLNEVVLCSTSVDYRDSKFLNVEAPKNEGEIRFDQTSKCWRSECTCACAHGSVHKELSGP